MAAYRRVDDDILIRSPNGSVLCHSVGSHSHPISVAGLITDADVTLAVEGNVRRRLLDGLWESLDGLPAGASPIHRLHILQRVLAKLDPTRLELVEQRPQSATVYGAPTTGPVVWRRSSL